MIIISRVLGNELKPREIAGARIKILERILEIESKQTDKIPCFWVINRVYDPKLYKEYLYLLKYYKQDYKIIPFEHRAYRKLDTFRDKVMYGVNVNAARNFGVRACRDYEFVIVADGDCYLMYSIQKQIQEDQLVNPNRKYYSIPFRRLHYLDHESTLYEAKDQQHMMILRKDADDLFDENIFFGEGDELELLRRIGYITKNCTCVITGNRSKVLDGFMVSLSYSENKLAETDLAIRMKLRSDSLNNMVMEMDSMVRNIPLL